MVKGKTLSIVGIVLSVISGWSNILSFVNSFSEGLKTTWDNTPPIIQLALFIGIFWWLGFKNKNK